MNKGKKTGLGRGFDTLLPQEFDSNLLLDKGEEVKQISVDNIVANPGQPRKFFDQTALEELAMSIKRFGVVQPLVVTPTGEVGKYEIIAGERRWRASKIAKQKSVPALVRSTEDLEKLELGIIENVQRVDLSPLEQAVSIAKLHEQFNISYSEIAKRLGKANTTINNIVRLLQLPEKVRNALENKQISEGHARSILALKPDEAEQLVLLELITKNSWSVRQTEKYVTAKKAGINARVAVRKRVASETNETKRLGRDLNTKVTIQHTAKGGKLLVHFRDDKQLKELLTGIKLNK